MGDADASCKFFAVPRGSPGLRPKEKDMENSRIAGSVQDAGLPRILDRAAAVLRTTEKPAFILSAAGSNLFADPPKTMAICSAAPYRVRRS